MTSLSTLSDLCTPWCVHVVATLRIADHIAAGKTTIHDLATAADCDADLLHMVLAYLVNKGLFQETAPAQFALNTLAEELLSRGYRLGLDLNGIGGRFAYAWGTLLNCVRTGKSAYDEVFGLPFWEDLEAHPTIAADFDALIGPAGHGTPNAEFQIIGGWESVRQVVDVGGGTGALLAELLRIRPAVHGILVDLPRTVARSDEHFRAAGVMERVTLAGQSFFDPLPTGADVYMLKSIMTNWPDPEATAILRRCAEAARPAGRVVVLNGVVPDQARRSLSIETVLLGGKTRSLAQFSQLADTAGLTVVAAEQQPPNYFVVECHPT